MLGILWFMLWTTRAHAFGDSIWYSPGYGGGTDGHRYDWQSYIYENFTDTLRSFARSYRRDMDEEMNILKAKIKLRALKIFEPTGSPDDFDDANGRMLPLAEEAKYCMMGRHTKVDCNHCTCVAGQLYMCTGMVCPDQNTRPKSISSCVEGNQRQIDSCNYCYCRNGREFCTTKDCWHNHQTPTLRTNTRTKCEEGREYFKDCNRCICVNGEDYCSENNCKIENEEFRDIETLKWWGYCRDGDARYKKCKFCACQRRRWICVYIPCHTDSRQSLLTKTCKEGSKRKIDSCNYCYCKNGKEYCEKNDCTKEAKLTVDTRLGDCSEGEYYRIDSCNFCFCYNGQDYCTHESCSESDEELYYHSSCEEGVTHQIDSCNYCVCEDGEEICTTHNCEDTSVGVFWDGTLRKRQCKEGRRRTKHCEICMCYNSEWYCQPFPCKEDKRRRNLGSSSPIARKRLCERWDVKYEKCNRCECHNDRWVCRPTACDDPYTPSDHQVIYRESCRKGTKRKLDACNKCYCRYKQWFCENKECGSVEDTWKNDDEHPPILNLPLSLKDRNCVEGHKRKIDQCNYCYCYNNHWVCENKECLPEIVSKIASHMHQTDDRKCVVGEQIYTSCHQCGCFYKGWICVTKPECMNNSPHQNYDSFNQLRSNTTTCEEGTQRQIDSCNYCTCLDGEEFCSSKPCGGASGPECTAEQIVIAPNSCNECVCFNSTIMCTTRTCSMVHSAHNSNITSIRELIAALRNRVVTGECEIGRRGRRDTCNYCWCNYDRKWTCTKHNCIRNIGRMLSKRCYNGERRQFDSCNYCICRGGRFACTKMKCKPKHFSSGYPLSAPGEECEENEGTVMIDCNYCRCFNGYRACTFVDCVKGDPVKPELLKASGKKCVEGQILESDGCNYCFCLNGYKACTTRNCKLSSVSIKPSYQCNPGDELPSPDNCNQCFCHDGNIICTVMNCYQTLLLTAEDECEEGTRRQTDACNYCVCNGGLEYCSQKFCFPGNKDKKAKKKYKFKRPKCTPGEPVAPRGCNPCICYRTGDILCTMKKCRVLRTKSDTVSSESNECKEGVKRKVDACNYCTCRGGLEFCTQKSCLDVLNGPIGRVNKPECFMGQLLPDPDPCNKCICVDQEIVCTRKSCIERVSDTVSSESSECKEGVKRKVDACNYCTCRGGLEFCTQKSCMDVLMGPVNRFSDPECVLGELLPDPDPCNKCICVDLEIVCTRRSCIGRTSGHGKDIECLEGQKYSLNDGCNYCVCQGGQDFCTSRACLLPDKYETNEKTTCKEGEVTPAKDGCNMCVCVQGKRTCTNNDCSEIQRHGTRPTNYRLRHTSHKFRNVRKSKSRKLKIENKIKIEECIEGNYYVPENDDTNCPNECICDKGELLCTNRTCKNKRDHLGTWLNSRNSKQLLKHEVCAENQPLPSDDPCNSCICLNERKVCTIIPCSDKDDPIYMSEESKAQQGNRNRPNNIYKEKTQTFCTPFTFFSPDKNRFCRNCFCLHNGLALCLLNLCKYSKDISHNPPLKPLGSDCTPGEVGYPTKCVSCTCSEKGTWMCTREQLDLCQERDCDAQDEFQMGFYPFCAGCKCAVKEWFCAIQHNMCQDYSNIKCPIGKFILNPRQHCSICLCGGLEENSYNMCFTESKCVRQVNS